MTVVDDNYTGHVEPQTAARRTIGGASIVKVSVGQMDNNAYLITCSQTGESLLIDAANDADILLELIERYAPKLSLIVTSHQHWDHIQALEAVAKATGVPTAAHELDSEPLPVKPDRYLTHGDTITIGDLTFDVIHLRGHTPGSVALA
ncbi:MAG TPA: MBL fold metallo-hydrolase, partial [Mycobacterium sp.]|nr:MBL fold metallo-hydrolase [Mycobacterium sp.]